MCIFSYSFPFLVKKFECNYIKIMKEFILKRFVVSKDGCKHYLRNQKKNGTQHNSQGFTQTSKTDLRVYQGEPGNGIPRSPPGIYSSPRTNAGKVGDLQNVQDYRTK